MPTIILHREKNAKFGLDFYPSDLRLILVSIRSNGLYEIYKKMRSANDCFMPNMPKFSVVQSTYMSKLGGAVKKNGHKKFNHALVHVADIWCKGALQVNGRLVMIPSSTRQIQDG